MSDIGFKKVDLTDSPSNLEDTGDTFVKKNTSSQLGKQKMDVRSISFNAVVAAVIVVLGTMTGFGLSKLVVAGNNGTGSSGQDAGAPQADSAVEVGSFYGEKVDEDLLPNPPIGVLVQGGLDGEGSHHILRVGGPTQTVYLTSSYLVLDPYIGHKVQVWGETFAAQKAAWLMDVTGIEIIELNAEKPFEEDSKTEETDTDALEEDE